MNENLAPSENDSFIGAHWTASAPKYWPLGTRRCGLMDCSGAKSFWRRMWRRRYGIRFEGVLYCHPQCLETAVRRKLLDLQNQILVPPPANRIPLGLLMIARGKLTYTEVSAALDAQRRARYGNIGEWFEKLGFATEQEITAALGLQWGCPVASSLEVGSNGTTRRLPLAILENFLMWPLHYVSATNILYIAFGKRVDHGALNAIEKMLGCRTQPCVASPKVIARRIERLRQEPSTREVEFGPMQDPGEVARIAISYIARSGAEEIRVSRLGPFIWMLLKTHLTSLNLLFRLRSDAQRGQAPADRHLLHHFDRSREETRLAR